MPRFPLHRSDVCRLRVGDRLIWASTPSLTGCVAEVNPEGETAAILVYNDGQFDDVVVLRACEELEWDDEGHSITWLRPAALPAPVQKMLDDRHAEYCRRVAALWQTAETYNFSTEALEDGALAAVIETGLAVTRAHGDQAPADVFAEEVRRLRLALEGVAR